MNVEAFIVKTNTGKISWKDTALKILKELNDFHELKMKATKTGYKCPLCESSLLENGSEFYCENENCTFDKIFGDLVENYALHRDLEEED